MDFLNKLFSNEKYNISKIVSAVIQLIIITIVLAGGALFNIGISFNTLKDPMSWTLIGLSIPLSSLAYKSAIDLMVSAPLPNSDISKMVVEEYKAQLHVKDNDDFEDYLKEHNTKLKREAYIQILDKKKSKLSKQYMKKKITEEMYFTALAELNDKRNDNIDIIDVEYIHVYSSHFSKILIESDISSNINSTVDNIVLKNIGRKMIWMILSSILFAMLVISSGDANYRSFTFMIILSCIVQFALGLLKSPGIYKSGKLLPLEQKTNILKDYSSWKSKNENLNT